MALAGLAGAAMAAGGLMGGVNGSSGSSSGIDVSRSSGISDQESWGYGSSASTSYGRMDAQSTGSSFEDSESRSWGESQQGSSGYSDSYGESQGRTYGREASAQDVLNAAEANKIQADLWRAQANYNATEAEKSRQWSQQMQDTYYQRLVDDLKKAGLNPILALSGYGSSSSSSERSGSTGHSENSSSNFGRSQSETTNNIREMVKGGQTMTQKAVGALKEIYNNATSGKKASKGSHSF